MKKFLIFCFTLAITAIIAASPIAAFAQTSAQAAADASPMTLLTSFITANPDRTSGADGEKKAADYLKAYMSGLGYEVNLQSFQYRNEYADALQTSQNVVAVKAAKNGDGNQVIIGAHYDSATGIDLGAGALGGDGTADNGAGVATAMYLAAKLKGTELNYTVKFVFFGAEELGLYGSQKYLENMTESEKALTLLMINFDSVGVGDKLYAYCDEVKNQTSEFFLNVAKRNNLSVNDMPTNRNIVSGVVPYDGFDRFYYMHRGVMSDNAVFMQNGINCLNLFSYNMDDHFSVGGRESANHENIVGTKNDTLETFKSYYGESGEKQMTEAAELVFKGLTDDGFLTYAVEAAANQPNYSFLSEGKGRLIILAVLIAATLIIFVLYYKKLGNQQKNAKKVEDKNALDTKEDKKVFEDF